jgi:isoleucyl-tRNA synthetase
MTLYTALVTVAKVAAPMVPFITEDMYQNLVRTVDPSAPESIHLCDFPEVHEEWVDTELEQNMDEVLKAVALGRACRNAASIKNRQPVANMYVKVSKPLDEYFTAIIRDELNVKNVEFTDEVKSFVSYSFKPQLRTLGPRFGKRIGELRNLLANLDGVKAMDELRSTGELRLTMQAGDVVSLSAEELLIEQEQTEGYETQMSGETAVVMDTTLTPELIEEGYVRELISKIQTMRKEAGFEVMDHIRVSVSGNDRIAEVMKKNEEQIRSEVLAVAAVYGEAIGYNKEWNVNGEKVTIGVEKN